MLDVHAPHEKIHGVRDFLLHLFTITIGLLIALSLEGCLEWQHHRHLVHEAEASLHDEIQNNAAQVVNIRKQVQNEHTILDQDLTAIAAMKAHPTVYKSVTVQFSMQTFDDVSWKTTQTTGAFAYMPYNDAREFSDIYSAQDELYRTQHQLLDELFRFAALFVSQPAGVVPGAAKLDEATDRIGAVQMRLVLMDSLINNLEETYKKYRTEHA